MLISAEIRMMTTGYIRQQRLFLSMLQDNHKTNSSGTNDDRSFKVIILQFENKHA